MENHKPSAAPSPGTTDLDERLDEALDETFPASDPVAIHLDREPRPTSTEDGQPRPRGTTSGN